MSEIDWTEFFEVLAGRGPMNAVRLQNRRTAHEDGAWVREAAAEYARKQAVRALRRRWRDGDARRLRPRDLAAVGGVRPREPRPVARARGFAARSRCRVRAAQRARCLHPPRRGHVGVGRARPTRSRRATPTRRARSSSRPPARTTATPGTTPRPRGCRTCDPSPRRPTLHGDVTVDQIELSAELAGADGRAATADVAEYALWLGDDALILSQQLGAWIARAPELEEDVALGNIALDLLGHARSLLRYAGTFDGRTEDDLAYWRDEPRVPLRVALRAAERRLRAHDRTSARGIRLSIRAVLGAALVDRRDARRDRREGASKRSTTTATTPCSGRCASRAAPTSRGGACSSPIDDVWPYVDELFRDEPLTRSARRDRRRGASVDAARRLRRGHRRRVRRGRAHGARGLRLVGRRPPRCALLDARAICSPRCRCSRGSIRGRHGDVGVRARRAIARPTPTRRAIAAAVKDPEVPVLTIEDLGVLRDVRVDGDRVTVTITPTYSGCPAMDVDPRRSRARAHDGGLRATSRCGSRSRRRGRPTG